MVRPGAEFDLRDLERPLRFGAIGPVHPAFNLSDGSGSETDYLSALNPPGTVGIDRVVVEASNGESRTYEAAELQSLGFTTGFDITGTLPDADGPELTGLTLSAEVDVTEGPGVFDIALAGTDQGGIWRVDVALSKPLNSSHSPDSTFYIPRSTLLLHDTIDWADGAAALRLGIPASVDPGIYEIETLTLRDLVGNVREYNSAELQGLGFATEFEVLSANTDTTAPELEFFDITARVNVIDGSGEFTIRVDSTDDDTGLRVATVSFGLPITYAPEGGGYTESNTILLYDAAGASGGALERSFTLSDVTRDGLSHARVTLEDFAGNSRSYSFDELTALGFNARMETYRNTPPTIAVADQVLSLATGGWVQLNEIMTVTDPDGDSPFLRRYELWDSTGEANWRVNREVVDASAGFERLSSGGIWIAPDAEASTQTLWIRVNDGKEWSAWDRFTVKTNAAPEVDAQDVSMPVTGGLWRRLSDVASITDANGDAIVSVELRDEEGGANWWADGAMVDATGGFVADTLSRVWLKRDAQASEQTLWVRASDGDDWRAWDSFRFKTNAAPVVAIEDQTIAPADNRWVRLSEVMTVEDANGDRLAQVEVWDDDGAANWWADGGMVDAVRGYVTDAPGSVWFTRDADPSSQTLWLRASDGDAWSAWDGFELVTV